MNGKSQKTSIVKSLLVVVFFVISEISFVKAERACNGVFYKSKMEDVPVYAESDLTAEVVARLSLGEEVCYVGEEKEFAIVEGEFELKKSRLSFVRLVDLWAPNLPASKTPARGLFEQVRRYLKYLQSGGVPEDPLLPYRPLLSPYGGGEKERNQNGKQNGAP